MPNAGVSEIDSGCCGMAGAFGYEAEHYGISMAVGEKRLFPAVRKAGKDTVIVADGISCRQQIAHGTKKTGPAPGAGGGRGSAGVGRRDCARIPSHRIPPLACYFLKVYLSKYCWVQGEIRN